MIRRCGAGSLYGLRHLDRDAVLENSQDGTQDDASALPVRAIGAAAIRAVLLDHVLGGLCGGGGYGLGVCGEHE